MHGMQKPTDAKLRDPEEGGSLQVTLPSELNWAPASVDNEHHPEQWFHATENLHNLDDSSSPFNKFGDRSLQAQH